MPRGSSRSSSRRSSVRPPPPPPVPHTSFANPMSSVGTTTPAPSFGDMVKQGVALGAGQAIAHRAIGSILGSSIVVSSEKKESLPCEKEWSSFVACMKTTSSEVHCGSEQASYTQCLLLEKNSK